MHGCTPRKPPLNVRAQRRYLSDGSEYANLQAPQSQLGKGAGSLETGGSLSDFYYEPLARGEDYDQNPLKTSQKSTDPQKSTDGREQQAL
jgi:hypothetical protein